MTGITRNRLGKTLAKPIRQIDGTGRLTLPHSTRRLLNLDTNSKVTVDVVNGAIVIRPLEQPTACVHCGGTGHAAADSERNI